MIKNHSGKSHWKWRAVWSTCSWILSAADQDGGKPAYCRQPSRLLDTAHNI